MLPVRPPFPPAVPAASGDGAAAEAGPPVPGGSARRTGTDPVGEIIEAFDDAAWSLDVANRTVGFYNPATLRLLGLDAPPPDLLTAWVAAVHPDDAPATRAAFERMWTTGTLDHTYRIVRPGGPARGEVRWLHERARPVRDDAGHLVRIVGVATDVTERKVAEAAAAERERLYRSLFEHAADAVFLVAAAPDGAFRYTETNPAHQRLTGLTPDVVWGRTPDEVLAPDLAAFVTAEYRRCLTAGAPVSYEKTGALPGGTRTWHTHLVPLPCPDGVVRRIAGIARDVSAVRTAEASARAAAGRLDAVLGALDDVVWSASGDLRTLQFVSRAAESLLGCPAEAVTTEVWEAAIHPDDRAAFADSLAALARDGRVEVDYRVVRPDGDVRWVRDRGRMAYDADGRPLHADGVATDVTERKRAAAAAQEARDRLADVLTTVEDVVWTMDAATRRIDYFNPATLALLGLPSAPADVEAAWDAAVHPDDAPAAEAAFDRMWTTGALDIDYRIVRPGGDVRWVHDRCRGVRDRDGRLVRLVGVATDVTERKRTEHALAEARDAAEAAARATGTFLATMSHEIRTPMNGVLGFTELLRSTALTDDQRGHLDTIGRCGEQLLALLNDVLDYAKIEADRTRLERIPFALDEVVHEAARMLEPQAHAKGLALTATVALSTAPGVIGDPTRLRQVLLNLLGNAVKFTPAGSVRVHARATPSRSAGTSALGVDLSVTVSDTGIGIAPDEVHRLFRPFSQADVSTTRIYGGTGLGLAISKRLCEAMGGTITVESRPGEGAAFTATFRFEAAPVAAPPSAARPAAAAADADVRVLVAEDNPVNRTLFRHLLQRIGHTATFAENGQEALDALHAAPYDVVLMDVQMPLLDGVKATEAWRAAEAERPGERPVHVVAVTANAMPGDRERYLAAGMDDYVPKPLRLDDLRAAFDRYHAARAA